MSAMYTMNQQHEYDSYSSAPQYNDHRYGASTYNEEAYNQQYQTMDYSNSHGAAAAGAHSSAAGNGAHKILAERYKTKMCKKYLEYGCCPYEVRCMFAHGEAELRTAEMNFRDGLVTEDAIRHFRRMMQYKHQGQHQEDQETAEVTEQPPAYDESISYLTMASPQMAKATQVAMASRVECKATDSFRHNPYGFNVLTREDSEDDLAHEEHAEDCDCGECLYERTSTAPQANDDYVYSGQYGVTKSAAYDEHAEAIMP